MADFTKPVTTDAYATVLTEIIATNTDLAMQFDSAHSSPTNPPTYSIRWNSTNSNWEHNTGTPASPTWAVLTTTYGISISGSAASCTGNAATATSATSATSATTVGNTGAVGTNATFYIPFFSGNTTANFGANTTAALNFNPSTGVFSSTSFTGAGTGLTGTAASLSIGGTAANATTAAACSGNSSTATTATNLASGSAGYLPYQSAANTTAYLAAGTAGYVLYCNGAAAPSWIAPTSLTAGALATGNNYQVNSLGVGTAGSGTAGEIRATNNITAYYSDLRLKTDVQPIDGALAKVMRLRGITFRGNLVAQMYGFDTRELQVGVVAQDVQYELPMAVKPAPFDREKGEDGVERSKSGENYLTVQYEKLVPLLIEAIKEQQAQINALRARLP